MNARGAPRTDGKVLASLRSKLSPPAKAATELLRPRIAATALGAPHVKLVLVRAPAGFGKTTAMAQMRDTLEREGVRTAWLTLDPADNDISRFLQGLQHCADRVIGHADEDAGALDIVHRLADFDAPFALFLDDFEAIHADGVREWVRDLIGQLPPLGRVVLGSRNVPDLRLGRLRAAGQVVEIDSTELRFSLEETSELLGRQRHIGLAADDLFRLHNKTEGWITGLWLASVALERHQAKGEFVRKFSGSNLSVADYLLGEVLEQQSELVRHFLLRTSILKVLTPELCTALLPDMDGAGILRDLSAENVLLALVDDEGPTYRYHSLFAGFLRSQLQRAAPEAVSELHRKAARWFEAQGRAIPAVDHYLEGGERTEVFALMSRHVGALLAQGRVRLLSRWFSKLTPEELRRHPGLKTAQLWTLCFTQGPWAAMAELEASGLAESTDDDVWPHVAALRPVLYAMMDRQEDAYVTGTAALARLPSSHPFADGALINTMSGLLSMRNQSFEALEMMSAGRRSESEHGSRLQRMYAEAIEGMLDLFAGRIYEAHARFRTAVAVSGADPDNRNSSSGNAWAGLLYAVTSYERNQMSQAADLLRVHVPLAREIGLPDHMIQGYRMMSRIAFEAGDLDEAFRLLAELEALGHDRQLARVVASARLERSRVQLLQGHLLAAQQELMRAETVATTDAMRELRLAANDLDYPLLARLRWCAVAGDADTAVAELVAESTVAFAARRHRRHLCIRLVTAVALARAGRESAALSALDATLQSCHRQGIVRMVLDEGPRLGVMVRQLHEQATQGRDVSSDAKFVGYLADLRDAYGMALPSLEAEGRRGTAILLDPLTEKETHVLNLLSEGYSNIAMAEKLGITDSTIRTHLRSINSKLAVSSRLQAVSAARRLGIVR